jgi:hypothetical protein
VSEAKPIRNPEPAFGRKLLIARADVLTLGKIKFESCRLAVSGMALLSVLE